MISITRSYEISAGHHLPLHEGKCKTPHGHNYVFEVTVASDYVQASGPATGMVVDFADLDSWVKKYLDLIDHKDLNGIFEKTEYFPPTAENIASWLWAALNNVKLSPLTVLMKIRLYETRNSWVEVTR